MIPPTLQIRVLNGNDGSTITLAASGQLVAETAVTLHATTRFVLYHPSVVIDLANVFLVDPAGAAALGRVIETIRRTGSRVTVVAGNVGVDDALHVAGVDQLATVSA